MTMALSSMATSFAEADGGPSMSAEEAMPWLALVMMCQFVSAEAERRARCGGVDKPEA
jgi:hypothetical protein